MISLLIGVVIGILVARLLMAYAPALRAKARRHKTLSSTDREHLDEHRSDHQLRLHLARDHRLDLDDVAEIHTVELVELHWKAHR